MFYRYFGLQKEEHFQWLSDLLVSGKCFFPSAAAFNDPNEFRFKLRAPADKGVIEATWQRDNPNKTKEDFEAWYCSTSFKSWHVYYEPLFHQQFRKNFGVVCFSRSADNPAMWAHYANNHSGICVGFDDRELGETPGVKMSGDVTYQQALPVVQYFGEEQNEILKKIFFVKCEDWKYEREFRLVADANVTLAITPSLIREVIFGMHMDASAKERVRKIISQRQVSIPLHTARLSYATYEMEIAY